MSTADPRPAGPAPDARPRAVFHVSPLATLAAVIVAVGALPFATGAPWLWLVYLVPVGFVVWVLRRRTTVDDAAVTARGVLRSRRMPWSEIGSLRLGGGSRVSAVLTDGAEVALPAVHVRDLPALAAASGGHLPDPTAGAVVGAGAAADPQPDDAGPA
ncbi:MAG: PH domain-containing protein [Pseudonocardia sp.]